MTLWNGIKKNIAKDFKNRKDNFLKSTAIRKTMHNHNKKLCGRLYQSVKDDNRIVNIKDPKLGSPTIHKEGLSQSTLRSFYYYRLLEQTFGKDIEHVTDFGAGYGNNCRVWHQLGFQGEYFLIDLPEISNIQQFYTSQTVPNGNLTFLQAENDWAPSKSKSLFFATFSLNETPHEVRKIVEPKLYMYDYIFIHYNHSFPAYGRNKTDIDNREYFGDLQQRMSDQYTFLDIPDKMQNRNYMIGAKND